MSTFWLREAQAKRLARLRNEDYNPQEHLELIHFCSKVFASAFRLFCVNHFQTVVVDPDMDVCEARTAIHTLERVGLFEDCTPAHSSISKYPVTITWPRFVVTSKQRLVPNIARRRGSVFPFLSLPAEIRNMVYQYVMENIFENDVLHLIKYNSFPLQSRALLVVNRQISKEADGVFNEYITRRVLDGECGC